MSTRDHDLRESAMAGVGPTWRGKSLLPAVEHVAILERTLNAALFVDASPDTFDILALIFTTQAPWSDVFVGAYSVDEKTGATRFDQSTWEIMVYEFARALPDPITLAELAEIRGSFALIAAQIKASQWRRVKDGAPSESTDREPGNLPAPPSPRGMNRGWAGRFLVVAAITSVVVFLTLRGCS